jgi:translation initiation factor 1
VSRPPRSVPVYSTGTGAACRRCGWPSRDCRCATSGEEAVPERIVARLRLERSGRKGKTVTVVAGLPRNATVLAELVADLKRALGSGGSVLRGPAGESGVEIQGDHREAIRRRLTGRGWSVKG